MLSNAEAAKKLGYALGPHRSRPPRVVEPDVPLGYVRNPFTGEPTRLPTSAEIAAALKSPEV